MSRIPPESDAQIPQGESASAKTMAALFQVMAHRPEIMRSAVQLLETTMRGGTVDATLKELIAIRVSQVNSCFY